MNAQVIQAVERSIKDSKESIALNDALERLSANKDFKKIVLEGYFKEEAIRLVHLKGDESVKSPEQQASILAQIDAISALSAYFRVIGFAARQAAKDVQEFEADLVDILAEGND